MRKNPFLLALALVFCIAGYVWLSSKDGSDSKESLSKSTGTSVVGAPQAATPQQSPAIETSSEEIQQELEARNEIDAEQVRLASEEFENKHDADRRVDSIRQLSAYPTKASEAVLMRAVADDPDPDVRLEASMGLARFHTLSHKTIDILLAALEDQSEDVQANALMTLQRIASNEDRKKGRAHVINGLKRILSSNSARMSEATRNEAAEYIEALSS